MNGGKAGSGMAQWIVSQFPPHDAYIEPFLGAGTICRLKTPALISIVNDLCPEFTSDLDDWWPHEQLLLPRNEDALILLNRLDYTNRVLIYADPPYQFETRRGGQRRLYKYEFGTLEQHSALLELLTSVPAMVAISGYSSDLYGSYLRNWRVSTRSATVRGGGVALEHLWMNYPEPAHLADSRFVGDGFRAREILKRRRHRWVQRYLRMRPHDRSSILMALLEADPNSSELAILAKTIFERKSHGSNSDGFI